MREAQIRRSGGREPAIEAPTLRWSLKVLAAALAAVADGESYLPAAALGLWKPNDGLRHVSQRTLSVLEVLIHKINPKRRPDLRQMPCWGSRQDSSCEVHYAGPAVR